MMPEKTKIKMEKVPKTTVVKITGGDKKADGTPSKAWLIDMQLGTTRYTYWIPKQYCKEVKIGDTMEIGVLVTNEKFFSFEADANKETTESSGNRTINKSSAASATAAPSKDKKMEAVYDKFKDAQLDALLIIHKETNAHLEEIAKHLGVIAAKLSGNNNTEEPIPVPTDIASEEEEEGEYDEDDEESEPKGPPPPESKAVIAPAPAVPKPNQPQTPPPVEAPKTVVPPASDKKDDKKDDKKKK